MLHQQKWQIVTVQRIVIELLLSLRKPLSMESSFLEMHSLASPVVLVLGNETLGMENSLTMSHFEKR